MTVYIYGLWDPRDYQLRYIGKSYNPEQRLRIHIQDAKKYANINRHKDRWIRQLLKRGLFPSLEILEECDKDNWIEAERGWIKEAKEKGLNLVNLAEGGEGGNNGADISGPRNPMYGRKMSNETKRLISQRVKERFSDKTKTPWYGKHISQSHKESISKTKTGKKMSEDFINNLKSKMTGSGNPMYGKTHNEKARKKIIESRKRYWDNRKDRTQPKEEVEKRKLSISMMWAYRKNLLDKVFVLQKEYFKLTGNYHSKYPYE